MYTISQESCTYDGVFTPALEPAPADPLSCSSPRTRMARKDTEVCSPIAKVASYACVSTAPSNLTIRIVLIHAQSHARSIRHRGLADLHRPPIPQSRDGRYKLERGGSVYELGYGSAARRCNTCVRLLLSACAQQRAQAQCTDEGGIRVSHLLTSKSPLAREWAETGVS